MSRPRQAAWERQADGLMAFVVYRRGVEVERYDEYALSRFAAFATMPVVWRRERGLARLSRAVRRLNQYRRRRPQHGRHRYPRRSRHLARRIWAEMSPGQPWWPSPPMRAPLFDLTPAQVEEFRRLMTEMLSGRESRWRLPVITVEEPFMAADPGSGRDRPVVQMFVRSRKGDRVICLGEVTEFKAEVLIDLAKLKLEVEGVE